VSSVLVDNNDQAISNLDDSSTAVRDQSVSQTAAATVAQGRLIVNVVFGTVKGSKLPVALKGNRVRGLVCGFVELLMCVFVWSLYA
jgi:hypothetical protein